MAGSGSGLGMTMLKASLLGAVAGDFGIGTRAARRADAAGFQHEHGAAIAHDEAVALAIERPGRRLRLVIAARAGAEVAEAGQGHRRHCHVARTGQAHVHPAQLQPVSSLRKSDVAAGAGGRHAHCRPVQAQDAAVRAIIDSLSNSGWLDAPTAGQSVGLPNLQPLRADTQDYADADFAPPLPPVCVTQRAPCSTSASTVPSDATGQIPRLRFRTDTALRAADRRFGWDDPRHRSPGRARRRIGRPTAGRRSRVGVAQRRGRADTRYPNRFAEMSTLNLRCHPSRCPSTGRLGPTARVTGVSWDYASPPDSCTFQCRPESSRGSRTPRTMS